MIFYTLLFKIVLCQDLIIWLRATSLSLSPIGDYLYKEFCQMDDYAISIEFQNNLTILIFQGYTIIHEQQIQDNIGQWIKIDVFKQGNIVINEKNLSINNTFESIKFDQIKKNYNDFYLEITKDNKYNNFMLSNWKQPFINDLTFDAFISDQDAIITLWFKLMIDYDTINVVSLQNFKEYSFHIIIDILQISKTHLMYFINTNKQKTLRINGMQWNNVIIQLSQDNINLQILTSNQIINEDYTHFNIKNIINKEILVQQEGLYIGHLSIQYRDVQFYCSPGCIRCQNNKCKECQHGQYLVDNQCFCQKFYQTQNVDGECKMYPDLYQSDQSVLDYHLFSENNCSFGFIYSQGNCYPWQYIEQINSPWIQGNLCSDCIYKPQLNDDLVLHCWQNGQKIRYILDQYQYISFVKENTYSIINQEVNKQLVLQKNYKQILIDKQNRNKFKGALIYNGLIRCPYNCAQCQQEQHLNINYCINLLENQNYSQNIQGIPILNEQINIFVLPIEVIYRNSILYVYNGRSYNYLESIINNIEINSIILTGVHVIQLKIQLQMQYQVDQVLQDLNKNLYDLNNKINKIKTQYYLNFEIPFIHLLLESNMKYLISIDSQTQIDYIDTLTIQNMHFVSSFRFIKLHASQIIMKNIYFNHTLNNAYILCDHLYIENVIFEDIIDLDVTWFKIYSTSIQFQNVIINNCTLDQVAIFYLTQFNFKKSQLYLIVDQFYVLQSTFISTLIIHIEQIDCLMTIQNFLMNQTNLHQSNIIYSESKKSKLTLMRNFFILYSQIYKYLMSEFIKEQINTLSIVNCTLNDIYYLFQIAANQNSSIIIRNIILDQILLIQRVNFFIIESNQDVLISFILIKNIQIDEQYLYTIFIVKSVSVQLSFIQLRNMEITNFVTISCDQVFVYFINVSDMRVYQLFKIDSNLAIKINKIFLQNLRLFYKLFTLKSQYVTVLQNIIFSNFQLNKFETINKFIHLETFALSQALFQNLLFIDNYIDNTNFTFNFIEIVSTSQIITLSQIYFINNVIKTNLGNIITIQSKYLYINLLFVKNLIIINKQISQVNAFDLNGQIIELQNIKFQTINLVNCHLICQKGVQLSITRLNLNNITLSNSKLIYIMTYDIFLTKIINLNASYLKTDDILIKISSENIVGELQFYYSLMQNIQISQDIIFLSSDLFRIGFYGVKFRNVTSTNPVYLINQLSNINKLQILSMFDIFVDDSILGLAKLYGCNYLQIHSSKFTNIQAQQFIQINNNQLLSLHKTVFQNFQISNIFLNIIQSSKFANKITMEHLLINNISTSNNEAFIIFQNGIEQTFKNIYFINNSCNCSIFKLDKHLNVSRFLIFNLLFSSNNVTQIFSFNQSKDIPIHFLNYFQFGISQSYVNQQTNYFYINTKFDLPEFSSAQQQLPQIKQIKLNINDFNKLESYVQIEYRINDVEQNNLKSKYDSFYLPSGQILNQYKILHLDKLSFKQYIHKFTLNSDIDSSKYCNLNLIQINLLDSVIVLLQNYQIKLNQDLSSILQLQMDPYGRQYKYQIIVDCHDQNLEQEIKFRIKPFPCQMGEYYNSGQCNLCNIKYWYNSVKQNQNKCDYFDQSTVSQMKQGLLKLQNGYWRPGYHNKYISKCQIQQNCQGGWQVGDYTCKQGYLGALCSECDIYNRKGDGYYSKIEDKCLTCSNGNFKLITYIIIIFFYQLTQTSLAARRSYSYISSKKKLIQQNRFYIILKSLQVDQISICLKILQDIYIKLILINKLQFDIPDIIKIGFNIFPQQLVNEGLYCNISYLGPNILVLELIYIFVFTIILIQISNVIYIILLYRKLIQQSITYITSILQYGYKQSYFYISYLLLSQIIYVEISNELYLIGNQQYTYKYYKYITLKIILPIFLAYSIIIPLLIILIIIYKKKSNIQQFSKYWAYYIQDYNSKCQFWELYQLIKYSALLFIYFYYYLERNNQLMFFIIAILIDLIIQKNIKIYNIKNLNSIYFETQLKLIALLILFNYYYQLVDSQPLTYIFFGLITILNYYILKPILSNMIRIIIAKYIHYTIKCQNKLLDRFPKLMKYQRKYCLSQNPDRAKQNFQKLIKLFKNNKLGHHKYQKPIVIHHAPYNTSYLELQTSKELEMITL